jgi:hypothetical protein
MSHPVTVAPVGRVGFRVTGDLDLFGAILLDVGYQRLLYPGPGEVARYGCMVGKGRRARPATIHVYPAGLIRTTGARAAYELMQRLALASQQQRRAA